MEKNPLRLTFPVREAVSVEKRKRAPPARISSEGGGSGEVDVEKGGKPPSDSHFGRGRGEMSHGGGGW
jgi:hypothetical protein